MKTSITLYFNEVWGLGIAGEMQAVESDPLGKPLHVTHLLHLKIFLLPFTFLIDIPVWIEEDEGT